MSTHRNLDTICVVVLALTLLLTILFMNGSRLGIQTIVDEDAETGSGSGWFTPNDETADWDRSSATVIRLEGATAKVVGSGAYAYQGSVRITSAGHYVLSGSLTDGSVIVDAENSSKIWLLFDGVKIAFVGVTTPKTLTSSTPGYFQDGEGNYIYGFLQG